jgi:arginase family enzyme
VERAVEAGALPVTIGGDHSMAAGSIAGFARANDAFGRIGVIWIDAHGDIHTPETSPSKAYHGMPLAALLGLGDKDFATIGGDFAGAAARAYRLYRFAQHGSRREQADQRSRHSYVST